MAVRRFPWKVIGGKYDTDIAWSPMPISSAAAPSAASR